MTKTKWFVCLALDFYCRSGEIVILFERSRDEVNLCIAPREGLTILQYNVGEVCVSMPQCCGMLL